MWAGVRVGSLRGYSANPFCSCDLAQEAACGDCKSLLPSGTLFQLCKHSAPTFCVCFNSVSLETAGVSGIGQLPEGTSEMKGLAD